MEQRSTAATTHETNTDEQVRNTDILTLIINTHLSEYNAMRNEILAFASHMSSATNFSLIVIAALITTLPTLLQSEGPHVLLIATFPFIGLSWYIQSHDYLIGRVGVYLRLKLIPEVNNLIRDEHSGITAIFPKIGTVLDWENHINLYGRDQRRALFAGMATMGRSALVFLPIPILVLWFLFERGFDPRLWTGTEQILLLLNLLAIAAISYLQSVIFRHVVAQRFEDAL